MTVARQSSAFALGCGIEVARKQVDPSQRFIHRAA